MEHQKSEVNLNSKKRAMLIAAPIILLIFAVVILVLSRLGIVNNPIQNVSLFQKGPKVTLKTEYKNPFDKKTQYVNPFEEYKNPFLVAK